MPFPLNQQICTACITVTQLLHSKTASKLAAPIKLSYIILSEDGLKPSRRQVMPIKMDF